MNYEQFIWAMCERCTLQLNLAACTAQTYRRAAAFLRRLHLLGLHVHTVVARNLVAANAQAFTSATV